MQHQRRIAHRPRRRHIHGGHRAHQHAGVAVLWAAQHRVFRADFHHVTQAQHGHAVRHFGHHAEIVGDEEHARPVALLQCQDELENLRLCGHVQRSGGLVGNQQHRVQHQRHGNHDALALPARQLMRIARHDSLGVGQEHLAHDVQHFLLALRRCQASVLGQHFVDLIAAGHDRIECGHRLLKDHRHAGGAQFAQPRERCVGDVFTLQQDAPRHHRQGLRQQAHHRLGNDRFARAGLAHQAQDFAATHGEGHLLHGGVAIAARGQSDGQILH